VGAMAHVQHCTWRDEIFESVDMLNKINGFLCRFSEKPLEKIPTKISV
jgi:hypothetical protein